MRAKETFKHPLLALGLFIILGLMILVGRHKFGFHMDEIYSYGLANSYFKPFPNATNVWLRGQDYLDYLTTSLDHRFNYDAVYWNQTQDVHPPLYYWILHTISSFFPGSWSPWLGLSVNYLAHLATSYLLYRLAKYYGLTPFQGLALMLAWGLSVGGLSAAHFIRMYSLFGLWVLASWWLMIRLYEQPQQVKRQLALLLNVLAGCLTHYYYWIFAGIMYGIFCLKALKRSLRSCLHIAWTGLGGLGLAILIFPASLRQLLASNRGQEAWYFLETATWGHHLGAFLDFIQTDLLGGLAWWVLILVMGASLLVIGCRSPYKQQKLSQLFDLFVLIVAYLFIVQLISNYQTARYIYPIYPLIILLVGLTLFWALKILLEEQLSQLLIMVLVISLLIMGFTHKTVDYLYTERQALTAVSQAHQGQPSLILSDQSWKITGIVDQVTRANKVYPALRDSFSSKDKQAFLEGLQEGDCLIYLLGQPKARKDWLNWLQEQFPDYEFFDQYQDKQIQALAAKLKK
ncbi:hypothetical protein ACWOBE_05320 [Hutsoniella sourekii]